MSGENLFRDHLCASVREREGVCVCMCVYECLSTLANSNKQAAGSGAAHATLKPKVKFLCRQNWSFANGRRLIIIHYETQQT